MADRVLELMGQRLGLWPHRCPASLAQEISSPAGWRIAVAYELVSRLGWRREHYSQLDPRTLPACTEFLDAIQ